MEEKKKKNNKKKIIVIAILSLLILSLAIFIVVKITHDNMIKDIKNHYNEIVITNKNTNIFNKEGKKIGTIKKGYLFNINKLKINNTNQKYFNIKDTDYYLYYKDVNKEKKIEKETINEKYIPFNININSKKEITFYKNDKKVMSLKNKLSLPVLYLDDKYYYVEYLNYIFCVEKDKVETVENKNTEEKESEYISVIHYNTIYSSEDCKEDTCINLDKFKEHEKYLKESGFYSINIKEYKDYLDKKIRLKEKAILLIATNSNDTLTKINNEEEYKVELVNDETGLKFNNTNKKSTKESNKESIDSYLIKVDTSNEDFQKMVAGEEVQEKPKQVVVTRKSGEQSIPVINYHFFYDGTKEACNERICLDIANFRQELDYLRDNGYKTLTMDEFTKWMYGEIELPQKSVLLTIDDGAFGTGKHNGNHLIPILEEYNMHATLFLISGWWAKENYISKNLDIQSHTFDMHQAGSCGKGQVVCATHDELLNDLQKSLQIVDNNNSFCFPFYSYSDASVQTVKEAGFKIAFIGGSRNARRSDNKYLIPRYPIYKDTSLNQFINMVN